MNKGTGPDTIFTANKRDSEMSVTKRTDIMNLEEGQAEEMLKKNNA